MAVEMVAGKHGLGGFLWHSWQILRIEEMYVGLMLIGFPWNFGDLWAGSPRADRLMPWQVDLLRLKGQR